MADRLSRTELLKLSLDEYIVRYVAPAGRCSYSVSGQHSHRFYYYRRTLYQRTHYFAPFYQRQHQERLQRRRREQEQQQQRLEEEHQNRTKMEQLRQRLLRTHQKDLERTQLLQKRVLEKCQLRMQRLQQEQQKQRHDMELYQQEVAIKAAGGKQEAILNTGEPRDKVMLGPETHKLLKPINLFGNHGISMDTDCSKQKSEDCLISNVMTLSNEANAAMDIESETKCSEFPEPKKEEFEMEEDINSDLLYIPTNLCTNEL